MPNPLAWWAHALPASLHHVEVALTFFEQLVLPFFVLVPSCRPIRLAAGCLALSFQLAIVGTGNYAWINWIGIVPYLSLFDDSFLSATIFARTTSATAATAAQLAEIAVDEAEPSGAAGGGMATRVSSLSRTIRRGGWALWRGARWCVYVLLTVNIVSRSTDPILELFAASPWLHIYDDYFLVNSQGVFGFINKERVNLVLEYTHDPVERAPPPPGTAPCADVAATPFLDGAGAPMGCDALAGHCAHPQHGAQIQAVCPASCGLCVTTLRRIPDAAQEQQQHQSISWQPLDFMNLPGSLARRPYFNSPYHYRLDWEIWIQTTASLEGAQRGTLPPIARSLISAILRGDTDAAGLVAPQASELLRPAARGGSNSGVAPPTAIQARFYRYTFTTPASAAAAQGEWWSREPLSQRDRPQSFLAIDEVDNATAQRRPCRRSPAERPWLLLLSVLGLCIAVYSPLPPPSPPDTRISYWLRLGCNCLPCSPPPPLPSSPPPHRRPRRSSGLFLD